MRRACIDIGSNTTRLLVADCDGERLRAVHQERAFTLIGRSLTPEGAIPEGKIEEVAEAVRAQLERARELGAREVRAVATAAIRRASNGGALQDAIESACELKVRVLTGEQEARLAFIGATRTLGHAPRGELGVVDVGGGSSELVVGSAPDRISWWQSLHVGSGELADQCLHSDPPSQAELEQARARVSHELSGLEAPHPAEAVAVGGSATSLWRLAGPRLDAAAFRHALELLAADRVVDVAARFALDRERVRLLPAGLLILQGCSELLGSALQIGRGGVREGVLLEADR